MNVAFLNRVLPKGFIQQLRVGKRILQVIRSDFSKNPPILVYSMPKSGTSTIWTTLKGTTSQKVYKLHHLSDDGLKFIQQENSLSKSKKLIDINVVASLIRKKIDRNPHICWRVITSTREPIAQAISELFQGIDTHRPFLMTDQGSVDVEKAMNFLTEKFTTFDESRNSYKSWFSLVWFDWELKPLLDIDVYSSPYSHNKGYAIFESSKAKVLLIRVEDLNRSFQNALNDFLNANESFEMKQSNLSSRKEYREDQAFYKDYQYIKNNFKISRDICEKIYSTKYARHFYSEDECRQFIQRWSS